MKDISSKALAAIGGGTTAAYGYLAVKNLTEYFGNKSVVLRELLSRIPDLSQGAYQTAEETARGLVNLRDLCSGVMYLIGAGICAGLTLYHSNKMESD